MVPPSATAVDAVPDGVVTALVGPRAFFAGQAYAAAGRVVEVSVSADGTELAALVQGSYPAPYQLVVTLDPRGSLSSSCSCPIGYDCKHVAAALLAARAHPLLASADAAD
jgi:uncharacterized Zn finger protein